MNIPACVWCVQNVSIILCRSLWRGGQGGGVATWQRPPPSPKYGFIFHPFMESPPIQEKESAFEISYELSICSCFCLSIKTTGTSGCHSAWLQCPLGHIFWQRCNFLQPWRHRAAQSHPNQLAAFPFLGTIDQCFDSLICLQDQDRSVRASQFLDHHQKRNNDWLSFMFRGYRCQIFNLGMRS